MSKNKNFESNLLLLSSSRVGETNYLEHALDMINAHLKPDDNGQRIDVLFIPYAGVTISYDEYTNKVAEALACKNINVIGIHTVDNPIDAIYHYDAVLVGGGNTFNLLTQLYTNNLITPIQQRVSQGMKYIGWSAGSNIAGLSIRTTNDMPIIEPPSFNALNLVNIQINPHYTDYNPPGHNGETREERLNEFMVLNPDTLIVGIVEGTALKVTGDKIKLVGNKSGFVFKGGKKYIINANSSLKEFTLKPAQGTSEYN